MPQIPLFRTADTLPITGNTSNKVRNPSGYDPESAVFTENAFDRDMLAGDLSAAQVAVDQFIERAMVYTDRGIYPTGLSRLAIKQVALPLYARAMYDEVEEPYEDSEIGSSGVYADAVGWIEYLQDWTEQLSQNSRLAAESVIMRELRESIARLIVFSLSAREIKGAPDDILTLLPATRLQDDYPYVDPSGKRRNFNLIVKDRAENTTIRVLTMGDPQYILGHYHPSIAVLSPVDLTGERDATEQLSTALSADIRGRQTEPQAQLIETATENLNELYTRKFQQFGTKAVSAVNL
jgi:hypothetical protein